MAWTTPMTFTDGSVLTAAQLNTYLRDNSLETAPAKATQTGRLLVTDGANSIAERVPSYHAIGTSETTTSTSYADLATPGPEVAPSTGTRALVWLASRTVNNTATARCAMSYNINGSGAEDRRALIIEAGLANSLYRATCLDVATGLTVGLNTFTCQYRVTAGTGTFVNRILFVIPL